MGNDEADFIDFLWPAAEAVAERLQYLNIGKLLGTWIGIVAGTWNGAGQHIQARRRQGVWPYSCGARRIAQQFGAWAPDGAANHIPNNNAVHAFLALDDFST